MPLSHQQLRTFRRFVYCSYWGTWNRLIVPWSAQMVSETGIVELDLTPINPWEDRSWKGMDALLFRSHLTSFGRNDSITDKLPEDVIDIMRDRYSKEVLTIMLETENGFFLDNIDFQKLRRAPSGGTPFNAVRIKEKVS